MTTRGGTSYQPMLNLEDETQPSRFDQMFAMLQSFQSSQEDMRVNLNNINKRLGNLGHTSPQRTPKVIPHPGPQVHILRETNPDNQMCGNVQRYAPSFDGSLDPNKFLNWLIEIEDYFEYHQLEDDRQVGLARMKLEGQARNFWRNQERLFRRQFRDQSITWADMKRFLRDQYLPLSY